MVYYVWGVFYHLKYRDWAPLRWPNAVFARAFADAIAHKDGKKTNMPYAVNRAIIFLTQHTYSLCYFSVLKLMEYIDGFSLLLRRYVRKDNDRKNQVTLSFSFLPIELSKESS